MISNYIERMKASFVPQVDDKAMIAMDGTVVVRTNTANGKEWLGIKDGQLMAYPEEMLIPDLPVYTIAKTINQVKAGDIVKATSSTYAIVEKVEGGQVYSVSFGGNVRKNTPITDFLTQQKTVRVVVNPFNFGGDIQNNNSLMLLMMLDRKEDDKSDIKDVMMLASMLNGGGNNPFGNVMSSPMSMLMFLGKDDSVAKDFMMMQAFQGANMFSQNQPIAKPVETPAE